ncbi:Alanine dehydrogenase [Listeria fleischmannii subsp. fleischmannii]|uniref:Alanine dehydrogenase n=2 Tax=Listeria fleischmannii TaxID=1069827 RepID=A0A2X3HFR5_9LIST|nr:Alanine dehydrogenase [Listeria fleischmannii subsp. fleischmannii]
MPGAVPRTSTMALTNATLQYGLKLANQGLIQAVTNDFHLYKGVNTFEGNVTYQAVARDLGYDYKELSALLNNTTAK